MRIAHPVGRKAIRIIVYPKSVINRLSPNDRLGFKPESVIRPFIELFNDCLQSFVFYKASFVCF